MRLIPVIFAVLLATPVTSQQMQSSKGHASDAPQETGQSAFAAMAEIVALLQADPENDWGAVNIDKLRDHLVDMDLLTRKAEVTRILRPDGARFEVRGSPRVQSAINTMVPAHAPFLAGKTGWSVTSEEMEDGIALIVGGDGEQIQGLGFFGLMTIGAHHQEHHLMIAKGGKPHH